ncbi:MAG: tRNA (N(6)-L-threonylcarbamoyladenosine(37)-C(2))-methylthiotransferase MtaB [Candidatus Saccharicenans sp.]
MTSVFIHNFGCRVNQAEAFDWSDQLEEVGLTVEKNWRRAELVVVNSCALTTRAEADVRQFLRKVQRESPKAKIILTGCLTEKTEEELKKNASLVRVIPNALKDNLVTEVVNLSQKKTEKAEKKFYRSRALIKVQDGCNAHCTFCIIPSLRGPSRSTPLENIKEKVQRAVDRGYNEVVLAGIHLCAYGQDFSPKKTLLDLLQELVGISGLNFIRLSSLDPRLLPENLLDFLVSEDKICPHFHLSLQHASVKMLKKMGRKSSAEEYFQILSYLRKSRPEASLGADIIVGFPEETEEDFIFLKDFLIRAPLTYFHVFSYSPRSGTPAANWTQVSQSVIKARSEELRKISREKNLAFRKSFIGRSLPAVVIKKQGAQVEALTANYFKLLLENNNNLKPGQLIWARIVEVQPSITRGEAD